MRIGSNPGRAVPPGPTFTNVPKPMRRISDFMPSLPLVLATLLVGMLGVCHDASAQLETNFWYFGGNAGLNFNIPPATPTAPAEITTSTLNAFEGTAVASDPNTGALLFYTNGITVIDRNNAAMPGSASGIGGGASSTQPALAMPDPANANRWYIVTTPAEAGGDARFSIVDMTQRSGAGDVLTSNQPLPVVNGTAPPALVAEKLAAKLDAAGTGYWVILREFNSSGSNRFFAYHLTAGGFTDVNVSSTGPSISGSGFLARGELKVSPDGRWLATANETDGVHLFSFNRSTGGITFVTQLLSGQSYGVSFSPNSRLLYADNGWVSNGRTIYQYDLSGSGSAIAASQLQVGTTSAGSAAMQIAPDGRIYIAKFSASSLAVINCPNQRGDACGFVDNGVALTGGRISNFGLPNLILEAVATPQYAGPDVALCLGQSARLGLDPRPGYTYSWSPQTDLSNPNASNPTANPSATTEYHIEVTSPFGCPEFDTVVVTVNPIPEVDAGNDVQVCMGESAQLTATSNDPNVSYSWTPAATLSDPNVANPIATATSPGPITYTVTVTSQAGCTASSSVTITTNPLPKLSGLDAQYRVCFGHSVPLSVTSDDPASTFQWTPATGLDNPNVANPIASPSATTSYTVTVTNSSGCVDSATTQVMVLPNPEISASPDVEICLGFSVPLEATGATSYTWSPSTGLDNPNSATPTARPLTTTTYQVIGANDNGCTDTAMVTVTVNDPPVAVVSPDTTICAGRSTQLSASGGVRYFWSPSLGLSDTSVADPIADPLETTVYQVIVEDEKGCRDTAQVTVTVLTLELTIALPDTVGDPHDKAYVLPVRYAINESTMRCVPDSFTVTFRFDNTMFFPDGVTGGRLIDSHVENGERIIHVAFPGSAIDGPSGTLGSITGSVLLGQSVSTPLHVDSVNTGDLVADATLIDGRLTLDSICSEGGDRLLRPRESVAIKSIVPNPAGAGGAAPTVETRTWTLGHAWLEIYSESGDLVYRTDWTPTAVADDAEGVAHATALPADLPSGVYLVVARTAEDSDSKSIIIAR